MLEIRLKRRLRSLEHLLLRRILRLCVCARGQARRAGPPDRRRHHQQDRFLSRGRPFRLPRLQSACRTWRRARAPPGSPWSGARAAPPARSPIRWPWCSASMPQACPGFRFRRAGHRYLDRGAGQGRAWESSSPRSVSPVPRGLRRKYFMRSRDPESDLLRVVPELRALVEFRRLNFMDADFGLPEPAEIIFCRNVIIYFDRPTQVRLLKSSPGTWRPAGISLRATPSRFKGWICLWCRWRRRSTGRRDDGARDRSCRT